MLSRAIVRSADDFAPIVRLADELIRLTDDLADIVGRPDDLPRERIACRPRRRRSPLILGWSPKCRSAAKPQPRESAVLNR
jgi:hypothetical protein